MSQNNQGGRGRPCTHGVHYLLRTGNFPKKPSLRGINKLKQALEDIRGALVEDLGGTERVSTAQLVALDDLMTCKRIVGYIQLLINEHGLLDPKSVKYRKELRLHPVLQRELLSYMRMEKDLLNLLFPDGLGGRTKEAFDPIAFGRETCAIANEENDE